MRFNEVADRIWVARHPWLDVNVTAVGGTRGLLVVDTGTSAAAGRQIIGELERLGAGRVVEIANTHDHFDHVLGNGALRGEFGEVPIRAHEAAAEEMAGAVERAKREAEREIAGDPEAPHAAEVAAMIETEVVLPDHTFSSAMALDLGDRFVEIAHPGRGHTAGDLVVRVPDADVVLAGDLIEESAERENAPGFGPDCYPWDWPLTLDVVLGLTTGASTIVPGHGSVVDRAFVEQQRNDIGILAETIRDLAQRRVPVDEALAQGEWPFPVRYLRDAVTRGYELLPQAQKRLPLV
ncbi:MBL fold metallo-hydrolase [Nocardioides sp. GXZ039]|uniref:MBL fold metallo-hydrolase n=1 Tax=Nocardioides sp. GXZ039 TaxID=3136018 RepID=UPI0030F38AA9